MELPTALVLNLIDAPEHCDMEATWVWDELTDTLRSASVELKITIPQVKEYLNVLWRVFQSTDKDEKSVEIRLIQAIVKDEHASLVPQLLEALNFASSLSHEFWYFCGCVVKCDTISHADVLALLHPAESIRLWRIADKLPCQPVLTYITATEDYEYLLRNNHLLSWHKEDKRLWLDLFFRHFLKQCTLSGVCMDTFAEDGTRLGPVSHLVFNSVPEEIRYSPEAIQMLIDHNCVHVIEKALELPPLPLTDIARACVPYLCTAAGWSQLKLFRRVVPNLDDEDMWWKLVTGFKNSKVKLDDVNSNWLMNASIVPDQVLKRLCENADDYTRTLRLAVHANDSQRLWTLGLANFNHINDVRQNAVVVFQKVIDESKSVFIDQLIRAWQMSTLKTVTMVMDPCFPLMEVAAHHGARVFLHMQDMFKYETDSSKNKKLAHLFYGRLCGESTGNACSIALAHYLLRVFDKNAVQTLQGDDFVMPIDCCEQHLIEGCCPMCCNLFNAAAACKFKAVRHFLNNPQ